MGAGPHDGPLAREQWSPEAQGQNPRESSEPGCSGPQSLEPVLASYWKTEDGLGVVASVLVTSCRHSSWFGQEGGLLARVMEESSLVQVLPSCLQASASLLTSALSVKGPFLGRLPFRRGRRTLLQAYTLPFCPRRSRRASPPRVSVKVPGKGPCEFDLCNTAALPTGNWSLGPEGWSDLIGQVPVKCSLLEPRPGQW